MRLLGYWLGRDLHIWGRVFSGRANLWPNFIYIFPTRPDWRICFRIRHRCIRKATWRPALFLWKEMIRKWSYRFSIVTASKSGLFIRNIIFKIQCNCKNTMQSIKLKLNFLILLLSYFESNCLNIQENIFIEPHSNKEMRLET